MDICCNDHVVDEDRINPHANHDEEALKRQCKQSFEIVRPDAAPFAVTHGCDGNWRDADRAIYLNHSTIEDDHDENGHDFEA